MIFQNIFSELSYSITFLLQFFTAPKIIGAIVPSSPRLSDFMTNCVDLSYTSSVVEFGPGTGAITCSILKKINPKATFLAIEINPRMVKILRHKYPDVIIYNDTVINTAEYLAKHGHSTADCIISGLPWAIFDDQLQNKILNIAYDSLTEQGEFVTFAYLHGLLLPSGQKFRKKIEKKFSRVTRSKVIWRNLPPAVVYHAQK